MVTQIPLAKPSFDDREVEAVRCVLESGWVVQGAEVASFEETLAAVHNSRHCIAVSSGTAALHLSYLALNITQGDAIFIPSFAWPSAANMAMAVGARPVFVDVLPDTYNMDPGDLRRQIQKCLDLNWATPKVVVPVHEFGLPADLKSISNVAREFNLHIVEDAACALGARYEGSAVGTFGRMGIFSFHPRKAVTTGEGGAIITNDDALARACRMWRNHGQIIRDGQREFCEAGFNYRMTELQAAIGRVQLEKLRAILSRRRLISRIYLDGLKNCPGIRLPVDHPDHTWQTFMIVFHENIQRKVILDTLAEKGIGAGPGSVAAHSQELFCRRWGYRAMQFPISEQLSVQGLALPLYSDMENAQVFDVIRTFRKIMEKKEIFIQPPRL